MINDVMMINKVRHQHHELYCSLLSSIIGNDGEAESSRAVNAAEFRFNCSCDSFTPEIKGSGAEELRHTCKLRYE